VLDKPEAERLNVAMGVIRVTSELLPDPGSRPSHGKEVLMRELLALIVVIAAFGGAVRAEEPRTATLYKNPACTCCETHADYLRDNGFVVRVEPTHDLPLLKRQYGVPAPMEGCHTTLVEGYVVEGHVPINAVLRLLNERPDVKGISLPGMPAGSPGMFGEKTGPFTIYEIGDGPAKVYAVE
jgi:hypothetical protein